MHLKNDRISNGESKITYFWGAPKTDKQKRTANAVPVLQYGGESGI